MNARKLIVYALLILALAIPVTAAERFRTDINPALLCYQAFALRPDLSEEDHQYLFAAEWRGRPLEPRFEALIVKFDNMFKLLHQAARSRVPCDWGLDLTQGPETLIPSLAKAKSAVQTARLRVRWHLEHGRESSARDDLLAAFALGRNVSKDGVLISAMVQMAIENIVTSIVAEHFFQFGPETLQQLIDGFDASPVRGTIQQCMAAEKSGFCDWYLVKIQEFQAASLGNETQVLGKVRSLLAKYLSDSPQPDPELAERIIQAAGGTSAGVVDYIKQLHLLYAESTAILGMPVDEYGPASKAFAQKLKKHPNLLVQKFFPVLDKARGKEFAILSKLAMVRAAVEYRLRGEEAFQKVLNPSGHGPFALQRFVFEDMDRGFVLEAEVNWSGFDEKLIFVENDGPPFQVHGKSAGKALLADPLAK